MKQVLISSLSSLAATVALAAAPSVSNVALVQDEESQELTITYDLDAEGIVIAEILTNGASVGWSNLRSMAGAVNRQVSAGTGKQIWWRPDRTWPAGVKLVADTVTARVTAYSLDAPPDYVAVDVTGTQAKFYYPNEEALPGGIGDRIYRTDMMLFRLIKAANVTFRMGVAEEWGYQYVNANYPHNVTLTNDYWLGVFPVTQGQFANVLHFGTDTCRSYFPANMASYNVTNGADAVLCPVDNVSAVCAGPDWDLAKDIDDFTVGYHSVMYAIRSATGFSRAYLPTLAEWEFAARAGSGEDRVYEGHAVDDVAWHAGNSAGRLQPVGLKRPNAWGLYDLFGNVWERTRDSAVRTKYTTDQVAPMVGSTDWATGSTGGRQAMVGGAFDTDAADICFAKSIAGTDDNRKQSVALPGWGFRVMVPLK
ncbi:MAG: formylglycine-generating enzyme family protein [Kiritimatiellia bacterium]